MHNIEIIEHRGGWLDPSGHHFGQNSMDAFFQSLGRENGIELDIRDSNERIVISHDIPKEEETSLEMFLKFYVQKTKKTCKAGTLALNIKSCGLENKLKYLLEKYGIKNYFVFDLAVPDMKCYLNKNIYYYVRHSDYESDPSQHIPCLYHHAKGVWLDQFDAREGSSPWITMDILCHHLKHGKEVSIVSPELHRCGTRNPKFQEFAWQFYKKYFLELAKKGYNLGAIKLCTDFPIKAEAFFNE